MTQASLSSRDTGLLVISNSDAGSSEGLDAALAVLPDAEVCATQDAAELDGVLERARGRRVVVAGGDGSLHAVVACLHRREQLAETEVALVPLGTGNDFARGANIPLDPAEAAALAREGEVAAVDLLTDDEQGVVVNNVHVGAGAEASRQAERWKRLGRVGYAIGALIAGVNPPTVRMRVTVDGVVISDRPTLQVAIGNAPYVGGGTELTPEADPTDGHADVMVSYATSIGARIGYLLHLRKGSHHERDDVVYGHGSVITVSGKPFFVSADGEIHGPVQERTWRVQPGALRMVLGPA